MSAPGRADVKQRWEFFTSLRHLQNKKTFEEVLDLASRGMIKESFRKNVEGEEGVFLSVLKWKIAMDYRVKGPFSSPPSKRDLLSMRRKKIYRALECLLTSQNLKTLAEEIPLVESEELKERGRREGERILKNLKEDLPADPFLQADFELSRLRFYKAIQPGMTHPRMDSVLQWRDDPYHFPLLALEAAETALLADSPGDAVRLTEEGLGVAVLNENYWLAGNMRVVQAEAFRELGRLKEAEVSLKEGAEAFRRAGQRLAEALSIVELSLLYIREGRLKEAKKVLKRAARGIKRYGGLEEKALLTATEVFYLFRSGCSRRKKKKALLSAIARYPFREYRRAYNILWEAVEGEEWLKEDKETAMLFESGEEVSISRSVVEMIKENARAAYPDEFGALLHGYPQITSLEPIVDSARGRRSFVFSMWDRFSGKALVADGMVHSHPSGVARPSRADLYMFSRFRVNLIIGYPFTDDSIAAYDSVGNRIGFRIVED